MKNLVKKFSIGTILLYAIFLLIQLWFDLFELKTFVKITVTFFVLFAVVGIIHLIKCYYDDETALKKNKYLN